MAELIFVKPLERAWEWIEHTGGYPGKMMLAGLVILLVVGVLTWVSNRR